MSHEGNTTSNAFTSTEAHENDHPPAFQAEVLAMLAEMKSGMQSMSGRISELERGKTQSVLPATHTPKGKGKAPQGHSTDASSAAGTSYGGDNPCDDDPESVAAIEPTRRSKHWADRDDEVMDYEAELVWDDEDEKTPESKGIALFKVGEKTEKFLVAAFSSAASNTTRRQWRDKYGAPNTAATACPNLDKVIKGRLPAATKSRDRQLAKQQALMLDAVGPVAHILEEAVKGQLTQKCAIEAAQTALKLIGNASVHACRERRKNALQSMNTRLLDMADDDETYKSASPLLFGDGFCKKAKERDEELKCLNMASSKASGGNREQFFRGGRSFNQQPRGNGQNLRGRRSGYQRQHPYNRPQQSQWPRRQDSTKKTQNSQ